jgi:hypothetical protein
MNDAELIEEFFDPGEQLILFEVSAGFDVIPDIIPKQ